MLRCWFTLRILTPHSSPPLPPSTAKPSQRSGRCLSQILSNLQPPAAGEVRQDEHWHCSKGTNRSLLHLLSYLRYQNLLYLKYLAVESTHRDRGIGGRLLRLISKAGEEISQMFGLDGCRGTLIEVERPDDSLSVAEQDLRIRRIGFYLRNGAVPSGMLFEHPVWAPPEMPNWDIMILPGYAWTGSLDEPSRQALSSSVLAEIRASLGLEIEEM